jgi:catechol 2,3-dioxygenase-like lactoylglutathione lyase family enzyme
MHHFSIRTADIHRAIAFYELLDFAIEERFTAGMTLACWLVGPLGRIELLQVPEPAAPPDPFGDESYVGYYHASFDLSDRPESLPTWLDGLAARVAAAGDRLPPLRILLPPCQQMIGTRVYEVAFIADADGMPLEFLKNPSVELATFSR